MKLNVNNKIDFDLTRLKKIWRNIFINPGL